MMQRCIYYFVPLLVQVHGFPQIMGVLTHLDQFRNKKKLKKTKKTLKHRFWTEVYPGAKLFYLSGYFPITNTYPKNEVHNLARFISVMKFRPTVWRLEHSYIVADRMEDLTSGEVVRQDAKADRRISLYGWVHGTFLKETVSVHIPGLGDFTPDAITALPDPCPLPMKERVLRRSLNEKEKVIYAPFSGVGGIVYDQDAVYIDLGGSHSHKRHVRDEECGVGASGGGNSFVEELRDLKTTLDEKMGSAGLKFFSESEAITGAQLEIEGADEEVGDDHEEDMKQQTSENEDEEDGDKQKKFTPVVATDGRIRRKVVFEDDDDDDVTNVISKEIASLKRTQEQNAKDNKTQRQPFGDWGDNNENDDEKDDDDDDDEMAEESESDDEDVKVFVTSENKKSAAQKQQQPMRKQEFAADESISSLVSKIKSKLNDGSNKSSASKENGIAEKAKNKVTGGMATELQVEFDDDEDDDSENDGASDDALSLPSDDDEDDEEEEMSMDEDEEEELSVPSRKGARVAGSVGKSLSKEKAQRYSLAEEAFYSRFQNRSIQKMIYDDADDYLNVSSRADFDQANCILRVDVDNNAYSQNRDENDEEGEGSDPMKDLFIGGDYAETAQNLLDHDGEASDEEDVFGDFEELDDKLTKSVGGEKKNEETHAKQKGGPENEENAAKTREEMKKKLKEKFDMDYDDGGEKDDKAFYRDWKAQVEEQTKVCRIILYRIIMYIHD